MRRGLCASEAAGSINDLPRNIRQWHYVRQNAELSTDAGHAIHGASRFILPDGKASLAENGAHAGRSVRAHSRHDDSDDPVPEDLYDGSHQK